MKYYIGRLHEINGSYEYYHDILFHTAGKPETKLRNIAKKFYVAPDKVLVNSMFSFFNCEILIEVDSVKEIPPKLYLDMKSTGFF